MRYRCRHSLPSYENITVCPEWDKFTDFKNWAMNNGYSDDLTIDRIDNSGNYTPENCRWATREQQTQNRDCTILTEKSAGEILWLCRNTSATHKEIALLYGVRHQTVSDINLRKTWKNAVEKHSAFRHIYVNGRKFLDIAACTSLALGTK